jgi:hypothetical protein
MATPTAAPTMMPQHGAIPAAVFNVCFVLLVINISYF